MGSEVTHEEFFGENIRRVTEGLKQKQMEFKIERLTAFVAVDPKDGDEGVIAMMMDDQWVPLIAADQQRAELYFPIALKMCRDLGQELRILSFDNRQDVTKEYEES